LQEPSRSHIDIWRKALDETVQSVRLTHFSDHAGFGASNPVVRPDGRHVVFQLRRSDAPPGNGLGLLLLDLEAMQSRPGELESAGGS
jgi:hypothetical protein